MASPIKNFEEIFKKLRFSINDLEKDLGKVDNERLPADKTSSCKENILFSMLKREDEECSHINIIGQEVLRQHKLSFYNFLSAFKLVLRVNEAFQNEIGKIMTGINNIVGQIDNLDRTKSGNNTNLIKHIEEESKKYKSEHAMKNETCNEKFYLVIFKQYLEHLDCFKKSLDGY